MNLTLYLLFAHFLADYPLQTNWIAKHKEMSWPALFLHTSIHLVVSFLIAIPFLHDWRVALGIVIIFLIHNFSDKIKITHNQKEGFDFWSYMLDQLVHVITIVGVSMWLGLIEPRVSGVFTPFYTDPVYVGFGMALVLSTYFYDVSQWIYFSQHKKNPRPFKRNYKMMARNALIVAIAFGVYWMS